MNYPSQHEIVLTILELIGSMERGESPADHVKEPALTAVDYWISDLLDIAADVAGIPRDNTVETGACDVANSTGSWPIWGYCRDQIRERVSEENGNPDRQAAILITQGMMSKEISAHEALEMMEVAARKRASQNQKN